MVTRIEFERRRGIPDTIHHRRAVHCADVVAVAPIIGSSHFRFGVDLSVTYAFEKMKV
jgi:hypothetical protein